MRSLATDPDPAWRPIVSCNYCSLHWHFDCLNPPLVTAPNLLSGKRWMCPNHAEQVMVSERPGEAQSSSIRVPWTFHVSLFVVRILMS